MRDDAVLCPKFDPVGGEKLQFELSLGHEERRRTLVLEAVRGKRNKQTAAGYHEGVIVERDA